MISRGKNNRFVHFSRNLLAAAILLLLCSAPLAARNYAPETVTIKLPDGSIMRFKAVYLGIKKDKDNHFPRLFASRRFKLGSREPSKHPYTQQQVPLDLAGAFIGRRNGQPDWLYYLGETEVSRGQWNSIMRWMDKQDGKTPVAQLDASDPKLPQNNITVAQVYRFIEGLNTWILQQQKDKLPKLGQSYAFCRLPTEAEWAFAARGGINVLENDPNRFDRPIPYTKDLGKYEWNKENSDGNLRECGSNELTNPIGLWDMLGNVEELTISLFGPQYIQGRLGQFAIRGNSFKDAPENFDVSSRMEFASHDNEGHLKHSDKIGFRLALSSLVSASESDPDVLDSQCQHYMDSLESKELGSSTPATEAEQNSMEYAAKQVNILQAGIKEKNAEISRLQELRSQNQAALTVKEQDNIKLNAQVAHLQEQLSERPNPDAKLQEQLKLTQDALRDEKEKSKKLAEIQGGSLTQIDAACEDEANRLRQQIRDFQQTTSDLEQYKQKVALLQQERNKLADKLESKQQEQQGSFVSWNDELKQKDQKIKDIERQQANCQDTINNNAQLAKLSERRYLEALMRLAYTNAFYAYAELVRRQDTYLYKTGNKKGKNYSEEKAAKAYSQACQLLHDYWKLVVKMAEDTRPDLFPGVKKEVAAWLKKGENENLFAEACKGQQLLNPLQRQSLDLIERHVKRVRAGGSRMPDDLIDTFIEQPEFQ